MMTFFWPKGCLSEGEMVSYAAEVERLMTRLFDSLKEADRRRYAAIEAAKLGHGGVHSASRSSSWKRSWVGPCLRGSGDGSS